MLAEPRCFARFCAHYRGCVPIPGIDKAVHLCTAFPDPAKGGIPDSIAYGPEDHLKPVDGDGGVVYQRFQGPDDLYSIRPATYSLTHWNRT